MDTELEARLRELEDREAIRRLKQLYCQCVDGGWDKPTHDGEALAELFTEDGVMEFVQGDGPGGVTRSVGREEIRVSMKHASVSPYASHNMCGELIEVAGDTAHAVWHAMNYLTWPAGASFPPGTFVYTMVYHEDYVRTGEGWKIKHLRGITRGSHPLPNAG